MVYRQMRGRKIDVNFAIARGRARAGSWLWMSQGLLGLPVPGAPPSPLLQAGWMGALAQQDWEHHGDCAAAPEG